MRAPGTSDARVEQVHRLALARPAMTAGEREEQLRNAVAGNVGIEYPQVTRAVVDRVRDEMTRRGH